MKKQFYLLTAGLLFVCIAHAQIKKGDILLGGNVNFIKQTTNPVTGDYSSNQTVYSLSPSIARAVKDDLLVGLSLTYNHNGSKSNGGGSTVINRQDGYGLGFFVRKYKTLGAGFALFAEGDLGGTYNLWKNYLEGGTKPPANKGYSINAGFYPGVAYFISKHIQLETGLQNMAYIEYGHSKTAPGTTIEQKSNSFSVGTSLNQALNSLVLGIKWVL